MAHIVDCVRTGSLRETSYLPYEETSKYHLYPASGRMTPSSGRSTPDIASRSATLSMRTSSPCDPTCPQQLLSNRPKTKDIRGRRKISVPELGPMTTVQEAAMDSPTIPGRPPLHERSISAPGSGTPGTTWRQGPFGDAMMSCVTGPVLRPLEAAQSNAESNGLSALPSIYRSASRAQTTIKRHSASPKRLAPLVIPTRERAYSGKSPLNNLLDDDNPPEVPPKSPRRPSPNRMVSGSIMHANHSSAPLTNSTTSAITTPASTTGGRTSPNIFSTPLRSDSPAQTRSRFRVRDESPTALIDRGRPSRRPESKTRDSENRPRSAKKSPAGIKAFEHLPKGCRAEDAVRKLSSSQVINLQRQALGQAERFEVLTQRDVDKLSKELRSLDERCEYLRKTFNSLRSGRRSLHTRMISYLRAPRLAQFSRESILKQEEALAELDASIDDWVDKLAQADNRRTRIRQKLLEHIAVTLTLRPDSKPQGEHTPPRSPQKAESRPSSRGDRRDVESIKIYADSNVYALLADIEQEIGRMVDFNDDLD
ncbi:MAG: hypothetical protein M1839_000525 [Geoglossum umbratile]|nr:MAG: hypothetical protein M1839_000525 [Geoglossum umbratile]